MKTGEKRILQTIIPNYEFLKPNPMINSRDPSYFFEVLEKVQRIFLIFPIDFLVTVIISLITEISKSDLLQQAR